MPFTGKLSRPNRDGVKCRRLRFVNENQTADIQNSGAVQQQEKVLPQHEVNALVGAAKLKGHERGYQQAMQELQQSQQSAGNPQQQPVNQPVQAMASNPDDIRRIAAEEFAKQQQVMMNHAIQQQQQAEGMRIYNDLKSKFDQAKATNPGISFENTLKDFEQLPEILRVASKVDNSPDVIQHLKENPSKIANLRVLPENFADMEIRKLSDSIKQNKQAAAAPKSPEPLSQIRPSSVGVGNSEGDSYTAKFKGMY